MTPVIQYGPFQKQSTAYPNTPKKKKRVHKYPTWKKKGSTSGTISKRQLIFDKTDGICYLCGEKVDYATFSIDHFIPRVEGGGNEIENLFATHPLCNHEKGRKIIEFPNHIKK